jgi:hypothetical protein|tara:strand:+ start:180 stop:413 length:234 start_codon:yes stop_codon:yes gene_type:complete
MSESQDNIQMEVNEEQPNSSSQVQDNTSVSLTDIEVKDENVALNLFVSFLNLAQRRGAFNMQESAKIWECIQRFQKQ